MTSHRDQARRPQRLTSRRSRALLSLGGIAVAATGLSIHGTFAYFTDAATLQTGSFTAGTLDITLNNALAGQTNNGGSTTLSALTLSNMVPGESQAAAFPVANNGSVPLTYTVTGTASGALAPGMQFSVYVGASAAASNSGAQATGNRAGSCTGTALATNVTLSGTSTTIAATPRTLAVPSGTENICVVAALSTSADSTLQGATMNASLVFNAKQVGAP